MTERELATIKDNLQAYLANFVPIRIVKGGGGFYVFQEGDTTYIQYCANIHYLNGWLYGAVQAHCKVPRKRREEQDAQGDRIAQLERENEYLRALSEGGSGSSLNRR